jgi:hypothetical protein
MTSNHGGSVGWDGVGWGGVGWGGVGWGGVGWGGVGWGGGLPCAAAKIAIQSLHHGLRSRPHASFLGLCQRGMTGHHKARGTKPALGGMVAGKAFCTHAYEFRTLIAPPSSS